MNNEVRNDFNTEITPEVLKSQEQIVSPVTGNEKPKGNIFSKFKKMGIVPIILILVVAVLLIGGVAFKVVYSSPKIIFKNSINNMYKGLNNSIDEVERLAEIYDIENKAILLKGDVKIDTNLSKFISELNGTNIKINDFTLGGEVAFDLKNELLQGGAFVKGESEKIDVKAYVQDGFIYVGSNLFEGLLKEEYEDMASDFESIREAFEEVEEQIDLDPENYDYMIKAIKNALIKSLDSKQMKKESDKIKVIDNKVKVTKYSYTLDEKAVQDMVKSMAETLLDDKDFVKKTAKLTGLDKDEITDALKDLKKEAKEIEFDKKVVINVYTSGLFNKTTGISVEYAKKEYFHYYVDGENFDILVDNNEDSYSKEVVKITSEKKDKAFDVKVVVNDDEVAVLKVREFSDKLIDFDYSITVKDESVSGVVYLSYKEGNNSYSGDYKFKLEYDNEYISVEGTYGLEVKDSLEKADTSKVITEDDLDEEKILEKIENIAKKDKAFKEVYDVLSEAAAETELNSYNMLEIKSIDEVKEVVSSMDAAVLFVGNSNVTSKSESELNILKTLDSVQKDYGFTSYYYDYLTLPEEFKEIVESVTVDCVSALGYGEIPTNCAPGTNCMPVCLDLPTIYFIKDGKIVSAIRGKIDTKTIESSLEKIGLTKKIASED